MPSSVAMVDKVVEFDNLWRQARFEADNWNKLKNMASKVIGEKMKKKEPVVDTDSLEDSLVTGLGQMSLEQCSGLTVTQIKKVSWSQEYLVNRLTSHFS